MSRYQKGTVNNNWDKDQDAQARTTPRVVVSSSNAELIARYRDAVAHGHTLLAEHTLEIMRKRGMVK